MSYLSKAILYLRLPARADAATSEFRTLSIPFAIVMNGRLHREGYARLEALSSLVTQVHQVVMLLSASDVTVLNITSVISVALKNSIAGIGGRIYSWGYSGLPHGDRN